jgi:hypothetical protein
MSVSTVFTAKELKDLERDGGGAGETHNYSVNLTQAQFQEDRAQMMVRLCVCVYMCVCVESCGVSGLNQCKCVFELDCCNVRVPACFSDAWPVYTHSFTHTHTHLTTQGKLSELTAKVDEMNNNRTLDEAASAAHTKPFSSNGSYTSRADVPRCVCVCVCVCAWLYVHMLMISALILFSILIFLAMEAWRVETGRVRCRNGS